MLCLEKASNYELQFNARISLATTYEGDGKEVVEVLEKMLKDIKNNDLGASHVNFVVMINEHFLKTAAGV